ncbi:MAG: type II toxin-antitoxin system TacA family antitoxin [Pseudomonadota bacterium]
MASTQKRRKADRERKTERLELRVAWSAKQVIQRATAVSGLAAGDLAYEGARRVLEDHERMVLTGADRKAFLDAVVKPPEPTDRLVAALRRHRERIG